MEKERKKKQNGRMYNIHCFFCKGIKILIKFFQDGGGGVFVIFILVTQKQGIGCSKNEFKRSIEFQRDKIIV